MKTKTKNVVSLLATLAIGTASVAGLAFGVNANHGFAAHADTSITEVTDSDITLGINSVTLDAGEEETFVFDITQVGTYGFEWISGAAVFKFEDISVAPDPDDPIQDPDDPLTGVSDPYENVPLGLNEDIDYFYVKIATPDTAKVTIFAEENTEIKFEVTHRIDTGLNVFNSGSYKVNNIPAGEYQLDLVAGSGTVSLGNTNYVLDAEHPAYNIELSSPATTQVVISSYGDAALEFNLTFNETVSKIVLGANTLTIAEGSTAYVVINDVVVEDEEHPEFAGAGYYTFARTGGEATFIIENKTFVLGNDTPEFTVYIGTPRTSIISVSNGTSVSFTLSHSETDPNASSSALILGNNVVNATGFGEYYTFTATKAGTYELNCESDNAFIMVETEYGDEQILWSWNDEAGDFVYTSYTFTLLKGESKTFIMATNDWNDDTYTVNIKKI